MAHGGGDATLEHLEPEQMDMVPQCNRQLMVYCSAKSQIYLELNQSTRT